MNLSLPARLLAASSLALAATALLNAQPSPSAPAAAGPYHVAQIFHVGGAGGMDYVTMDPANKLLFVPRSTHTLVIDTTTGKTVADILGQSHNHGVALVPSAGRGFISDAGKKGETGSVVVFDLKTYEVLGRIQAAEDADGIIYDPASNKVLLVCGDAGVMIPISPDVDPKTGQADPAVDLGGKPEFLVADGQGKAYVNLNDKGFVAVVDTKAMKVTDRWSCAPGLTPVGMAMDRANRRLYIGCRKPQAMIVMSADDGKVLASVPIGAGVDATQFDDGYGLASCRDGTLTVIGESSPGSFGAVQTVTTKFGAKTLALDPATHTLYLPTSEFATPAEGKRPAAVPGTFMIVVVSR